MRSLAIRSYLSLLRMKLVNALAYRASAWSQITGVIVYGFIQTSIMLAFYTYGSTSSIVMSQSQAISHMWMVVIFYGIMPLGYNLNIYSKISSGLVAYDLCKPLDLYWFWYSTTVSDSIIKFWVRAPLTAILAFLLPLPYKLMLPVSFPAFLVFVCSIILAILLGGTIVMLLTLTFVNPEMGRGLGTLIASIIILLSGDLFPLPILPSWVVSILRLMPFAGLKDIPVSIYLGLIPLSKTLYFMTIQVVWIAILILFGRFILSRYKKSIVIQGG